MKDRKAQKLYELGRHPEGLLVEAVDDNLTMDGRPFKKFIFYHVDGMYSFCKTMQGEIIHLPATFEVVVIENEKIG